MPFDHFFLGEGSPTKIDGRKKGTLILTDLVNQDSQKNCGLSVECLGPVRPHGPKTCYPLEELDKNQRPPLSPLGIFKVAPATRLKSLGSIHCLDCVGGSTSVRERL